MSFGPLSCTGGDAHHTQRHERQSKELELGGDDYVTNPFNDLVPKMNQCDATVVGQAPKPSAIRSSRAS
jgi:hypothetical protein